MRTRAATDWRRLGAIVAAAVVARALVFGDPVVHVDEEFYFVVARAMWRGAVPFVDIWDRKPIGLFLLYMPAAALPLPWATYAYQAMAAASVVATAWAIARLADRAGWERGATLAGIAYVLWLDPLGGVGGQAPVFYNLAMVAAASLILAGGGRRRFGVAAMALVGVALQVKYSVVFEGIFFGMWLLGQEWRRTRSPGGFVGYGLVLVAVALAPTALAAAYYVARGAGDAFVFANFLSVLHRTPDPASEIVRNVGTLVLILSPIVSMSILGVLGGGNRPDEPQVFLLAWVAVALFALAIFSPWFDHYGLPVLVPAAACAAGFLSRPSTRRIGLLVLIVVAGAGLITVVVNRANRGTAAQLDEVARRIGRGSGCLWVQSGSTMLYALTDRCRVSKYVVPAHLGRLRERGAVGVDRRREVDRILAARPAVIVMRPPFRGEDDAIRAVVMARVMRDYRLAAAPLLGSERLAVYRYAGSASPSRPSPR